MQNIQIYRNNSEDKAFKTFNLKEDNISKKVNKHITQVNYKVSDREQHMEAK